MIKPLCTRPPPRPALAPDLTEALTTKWTQIPTIRDLHQALWSVWWSNMSVYIIYTDKKLVSGWKTKNSDKWTQNYNRDVGGVRSLSTTCRKNLCKVSNDAPCRDARDQDVCEGQVSTSHPASIHAYLQQDLYNLYFYYTLLIYHNDLCPFHTNTRTRTQTHTHLPSPPQALLGVMTTSLQLSVSVL